METYAQISKFLHQNKALNFIFNFKEVSVYEAATKNMNVGL